MAAAAPSPPPLAALVFVAAVALALVARLVGGPERRFLAAHRAPVDALALRVLVHVPPGGGGWTDLVWNLMTRAARPHAVQVCVLVDCRSAADARAQRALEAPLRHRVAVEHDVGAAAATPAEARARLLRRFAAVDDDGRPRVLLDRRARVVHGWDATLLALAAELPPRHALSAPTPAADGAPRFPTLRRRSTGAIARDASRAFGCEALAPEAVPSVCWCAELVLLADGGAAPAWLGEPTFVPPASGTAARERGGDAWRHAVPTVALLEHDEALEEALLDEDEGREGRDLDDGERVGLARRAGERERILKFGSTVRARLARRDAGGGGGGAGDSGGGGAAAQGATSM